MKIQLLSCLLLTLTLVSSARGQQAQDYVAHEWGTFTSVQGADGVLLDWKPLETSHLPKFVYDWSKPGLNRLAAGPLNRFVKTALVTLQRMETPVIYFYSDKELEVDVKIRFPHGFITEWYPQAPVIGPSTRQPHPWLVTLDDWARRAGFPARFSSASLAAKPGVADSRIEWNDVRILPPTESERAAQLLPVEASGNHYYAARETGASLVKFKPDPWSVEYEKFLFYRGVGSFATPLHASMDGAERQIVLRNSGPNPLRHLFILKVENGRGTFWEAPGLAPNTQSAVKLDDTGTTALLPELSERMARLLEQRLVQEGLYPREAKAMVATWRDSWIEETGLRVLYLLPREWTDATLPIDLAPEPKELVRVMVGRAEIIAPEKEWRLLQQIVRFKNADPAQRSQVVEEFKALGLGRFADAAVRRILGPMPNPEFNQLAWALVQSAYPSPSSNPSLAQLK